MLLASAGLRPLVASAQPSPASRVVVLGGYDASPHRRVVEGMRDVLAEQGFPLPAAGEGQGPTGLGSSQEQSSVLLTVGAASTGWVFGYAKKVPVVACLVPAGLLAQRPGNATGVVADFPVEEEFEWLHRFLPQARRVGVLYSPHESGARVARAREVAGRMKLDLVEFEIASPRDIPGALARAAGGIDVLWGLPDPVVFAPQTAQTLLLFSFRNRIPFIGISTEWVKAGALYALDRDYRDLGRQCGQEAVEILRGTPPADIPVAAPRRTLYAVNLNTARHMGIAMENALVDEAAAVFPESGRPGG